MKKYALLATVLGLAEIQTKTHLFGQKATASFTEEQLETIEKALAEKDTSEFEKKIAQQWQQLDTYEQDAKQMSDAISKALELNGLTAKETETESIQLLGETCKAFGDKGNGHTPTPNNGKEPENGLIGGYIDPNDEHNKFLNSI